MTGTNDGKPAVVYPVLLAGGSGTRLWPLSRKTYPKQFSKLTGSESLFQSSIRRLSGDGFASPIVVTVDPFRFIVMEQLAAVEMAPRAVVIEPSARNTAPAVAAAALLVAAKEPTAFMLVAPSDHVIPDDKEFRRAVQAASERAKEGSVIAFGITPTRPETAYGYMELAPDADLNSASPQSLKQFVEKPDQRRAEAMLESGDFFWNAGIFLATAETMLAAYEAHAPEILAEVREAVENAKMDLGFTRLSNQAWERLPHESIDYAIMEKADNLAVMPFRGQWSDLGGWEAVWQECGPDATGTVTSERTFAIDCKDTLLRSEVEGQTLVGIELEDVVAVAMPDAVLVTRKSASGRTKEAVKILTEAGASQAEQFPVNHRPWGNFESLALGERFQVKRINMKPGAALSLQSHHHRAEHWIVVAGTARVTIGEDVKLLSENESTYIPLGAVHRLENPGIVDLILIEVQTGSYLGEDDIIRYEDVYARS